MTNTPSVPKLCHCLKTPSHITNPKVFFSGDVVTLTDGKSLLKAIDQEHKSVTVIVHIFEENNEACRTMNVCLKHLCQVYENVKFCTIMSSSAGMSKRFKTDGVPALLVYKGGHLVGNFIRISDDLGNDFLSEDVQCFLIEHGMLEDKSLRPFLIRGNSDNDSD